MNLKPVAALVGLLLLSNVVRAEDDTWIVFEDNAEAKFSFQRGSGQLTKRRDGKAIYSATTRTLMKKTNSVELEQIYVLLSDCDRGQGELVTADMHGNYKFTNDWITGAGSVASNMADLLCGIYKSNKGKGL